MNHLTRSFSYEAISRTVHQAYQQANYRQMVCLLVHADEVPGCPSPQAQP